MPWLTNLDMTGFSSHGVKRMRNALLLQQQFWRNTCLIWYSAGALLDTQQCELQNVGWAAFGECGRREHGLFKQALNPVMTGVWGISAAGGMGIAIVGGTPEQLLPVMQSQST